MSFTHLVRFADDDTQTRVHQYVNFAESFRGVHSVKFRESNSNPDFAYITVVATDHATRTLKRIILFTDFGSIDQNADHDHDKCIENAKKLGVPESWAHRPETYLSM